MFIDIPREFSSHVVQRWFFNAFTDPAITPPIDPLIPIPVSPSALDVAVTGGSARTATYAVAVNGGDPYVAQTADAGPTWSNDPSSVTRTYTYQQADWLNGGTHAAIATHEVGFTTVDARIDLGMTFDSF